MGGKTSTTTQSVQIPPEVMARYNAVNARAEQVAATPFQAYGGQFVAPITPTQQAGIEATSQASQLAQPFYGAATGLTMAGAQDVGALTPGQIGYYQNPAMLATLAPTYQALSQQQGQQLSQQQADAIRSGAFGGDRANIQRGILMGQQQLGMGQALAPIYQQAYQTGLQTAQQQQGVVAQDLQRRMAAGQQIAGLGTAAQQAALQGAQAQIGAGTLQQQTQQADLTARYQQFLQERGYPFQVAQFLANIAMGTGALSGNTTTTTQPQSLFSDRRLKHDVRPIGKTNDGLPIYAFKYKGSDQTQLGLMAQDVEKKKPEAVGLAAGFKTVDYDKATEGSERKHRDLGGATMVDDNSMGGAVNLGSAFEEFARGGYAVGGGGGLLDANDLKAILASQQQSFGPFSQAGLYGGQSSEGNPMGAKSYVPKASLPTPKMITPSTPPRAPQSGLADAIQNMKQAQGLGEMASGVASGAKRVAVGAPAVMKDGKVVEPAKGGLIGTGGETGGGLFNPKTASSAAPAADKVADAAAEGPGLWDRFKSMFNEGGYVSPYQRLGYAGLGKVVNPMELQDPTKGVGAYIEDATEDQTDPGKMGGSGSGGAGGKSGGLGSDLLQAGQLAMMASKAAPMAAEGLTALAAMFSDKRLKSNIQQVGKTFDGQNIYTYNLGNGPTQMGLIAQEVAHKHPDAVGKRDGYMTVNYDEATENAAKRGHFYSGGLAPRPAFQEGGPSDAEAIADWMIQKESAGKPNARALTSSAAGLAQFTDDTAREVIRRNPQLVEGVSYDPRERGFAANLPPEVQRNMAIAHVKAQQDLLREQGFEPTRENIRMNWFLGESGGPNFLRRMQETPNAPAYQLARPEQVKANQSIFFNRDGTPKTASEVYNQLNAGGGGGGSLGSAARPSGGVAGPQAERASYLNFLPTSRDAKTGEESVNWKQLLIPALTGLGAAATTPTRNFGTALAAGLGAGAQSYANLEKHQADVDRIKMETAEAGARTANLAFQGNMVRLPNGQMVLTIEALKKGLIPAGAQLAGAAADSATARYLKSIGLGVGSDGTVTVPGGGAAGTAPTGIGGGELPKPVNPTVDPVMTERGIFGNASRDLSQKDAYQTMGLTPEGAKEVSNKYQQSTAAAGLQANENQQLINDLALNTSRIVTGTGFDTPGSTANFRAELAKKINTLVRAIDPNAPDVSTIDKYVANQNKLNTLLASQRTSETGQHNLGALQIMMGAMAQPDMPPATQAKITASLVIANQKARDRDQHREIFGDASGGSYALAGQAFDRDTRGRYDREQRMLETLILKYPGAIEKMQSGTKDPKVIESFLQQMAKQNGIRYTPGISRYFVEGGAQ